MAKTIDLTIVSAEAELFSGKVAAVIVPGKMGEMGIYPGHTALLSALKPGVIRVLRPDNKEEIIYSSGGILEVQPALISILADTALRANDLDEAAALSAKERAESRLSHKQSKLDYSKAIAELAEASAQLRAIQKLKKQLGK